MAHLGHLPGRDGLVPRRARWVPMLHQVAASADVLDVERELTQAAPEPGQVHPKRAVGRALRRPGGGGEDVAVNDLPEVLGQCVGQAVFDGRQGDPMALVQQAAVVPHLRPRPVA